MTVVQRKVTRIVRRSVEQEVAGAVLGEVTEDAAGLSKTALAPLPAELVLALSE